MSIIIIIIIFTIWTILHGVFFTKMWQLVITKVSYEVLFKQCSESNSAHPEDFLIIYEFYFSRGTLLLSFIIAIIHQTWDPENCRHTWSHKPEKITQRITKQSMTSLFIYFLSYKKKTKEIKPSLLLIVPSSSVQNQKDSYKSRETGQVKPAISTNSMHQVVSALRIR